jgi:hypothetical protein
MAIWKFWIEKKKAVKLMSSGYHKRFQVSMIYSLRSIVYIDTICDWQFLFIWEPLPLALSVPASKEYKLQDMSCTDIS